MLKVDNLSGGYGKEPIVKNISFSVKKGEVLGILGPNGSGKSTLLKIISGILPKLEGTVQIDRQDAAVYSQKQFARKVAVLPQLHAHAFSHTVKDTVALGRYPHQSGLFSSWSSEDESAVTKAMDYTGVTRYKDTPIELLSGGEQQRVFVAQALAQEAPILLLDEPTNHLDIAHQQQLLDTIRKQAIEKGVTVISVFHDINLASLYCDRLLLMDKGRIATIGEPKDVIMESTIGTVYNARVKTQAHPELPKPQMTLLPEQKGEVKPFTVNKQHFTVTADHVSLKVEQPLKTISSAVTNPGLGWYRAFVNRHVDANYNCEDVKAEMADYLEKRGYHLTDTVGMMTAVTTEHAEIGEYKGEFGTVLIMVTAGVGNAVDVSQALSRDREPHIGTINTWVIVNGHLPEEAFIQAMITATEAKAKALQTEDVKDPLTGSIATGTSTDSLLIAATQEGQHLPYAGPITPLGKLIGHGVYDCTIRAIKAYKKAKGWTS
ncbi:adenosylcobinamide amidohydrolase [Sporosarcina thermotolerans]|uniref:Adenosylcobinamide amidohydrolase n=1 Tax=Sporosarcina thermotolerans TaxID=633404 RepID=A0AAW9A5E6_9BACL|nr:adenosylcobinamide amidohydrolase [Sporosarcina thermotolerans]MDW0116427.1 adenosylcobinamide amidohydrolase [Sporosarcina thermotolerans]WHT50005.1 adenosylcobinamide amidohydrolase [Sporosarcina thermotolerans]